MYVSEIYIYPVKSLGGILLPNAEVQERGLAFDRRWVLADENNRFITQRQQPQLALIDVALKPDRLVLRHRQTQQTADIPLVPETDEEAIISIWDDEVACIRVSGAADAALREMTGLNCRLFFQPDSSIRLVDPGFAISLEEHVSLADGYPILMISQASLDDISARVGQPMRVQRFRPNIVVEGVNPFAEDAFGRMRIGTAELFGVKPCSRCVLTTIDPVTGNKGDEPLRTLATYRKSGNKIQFGQNVVVHRPGRISVGDEIILD